MGQWMQLRALGIQGPARCRDREMGRRNSYRIYALFFPIDFDPDSTDIDSSMK